MATVAEELLPKNPEGYLTAFEGAAILGVTRRTITRWIESGRIKEARRQRVPGGYRWLIPAPEIEALKDAS